MRQSLKGGDNKVKKKILPFLRIFTISLMLFISIDISSEPKVKSNAISNVKVAEKVQRKVSKKSDNFELVNLIYVPCVEYTKLDNTVEKYCDKYFEEEDFPVNITIRNLISTEIIISRQINSIEEVAVNETLIEMKKLEELFTTIAFNPTNLNDVFQLTNDKVKEFKIRFELAGKIETSEAQIEVKTNIENLDILKYLKVESNSPYNVTSDFKENVDLNTLGKYNLSYTIDLEKETKIVETIVNIVDTTKPVIKVNPHNLQTTFEIRTVEPIWGNYFTAIDNYDNEITINNDMISENVNMNKIGIYTLNIEVTDTSGNKENAKIEIVVNDTEKPFIISVKNNIKVEVGSTHDAIDWIDYIQAGDTSGIYKITENALEVVNFNLLGIYKVEYTVEDSASNNIKTYVNVEIIDSVAPTVELLIEKADIEIVSDYNVINWLSFIKVEDNYDDFKNITITENANEVVDFSKIGIYKIEYRIVDTSGNTELINLEVQVVDTTPPIFEKLKDEILITNESTADKNLILKEIVIIDNHSTREKITVDIIGDYNLLVNGEYEVSIVATDESGNSTVETVKIIVEQNGTYAKYIMLGAVCLLVIGGGLIYLRKIS